MVQIPPTLVVEKEAGTEAAEYLERVVNDYAYRGWEFYRVDEFSVRQNPGCLSIVFPSLQPETRHYHVVTFRRPNSVQS